MAQGTVLKNLRMLGLLLLLADLQRAQAALSLREAAARRKPDLAPVHFGETVTVEGRVSVRPIEFLEYTHVGIQRDGFGLVLEWNIARLSHLTPGDEVWVTGRIGLRAGLTVLIPSELIILSHGPEPQPLKCTVPVLQGFRNQGLLVSTEARVIESGQTTGGSYLLVGDSKNPYKLFLPFSPQHLNTDLGSYRPGDRVRATGLATQYCTVPPYNRWFQLLISKPEDVVLLERGWPVSPGTLGVGGGIFLFVAVTWWTRERRLRAQREMLRRAYQLGEDILGASSPSEILRHTRAILPRVLGITGVQIYMLNRATKSLDAVPIVPEADPVAIPLSSPGTGPQAGAVACFHYRTLLPIPDTSRSPFPVAGHDAPKSLLLVPMFAQGDVVGVFELAQQGKVREFSPDERALAQHLANQIGVTIRLLDQRSVREQLFRTEKLAAVGRLISGVVNELQAPLASISNTARSALLAGSRGQGNRELEAISVEARRAADLVARLVSFAGTEAVQARPVEINQLLRELIEFREREWKVRGIAVKDLCTDEPLYVLGSRGQLEQVFLALFVHAEQALADSNEKVMVLRTSRLAKRILLEISYSAPHGDPDPFAHWTDESAGVLGLGVCRSVLDGHGGEIRLVQSAGSDPRFEIELPWAAQVRPMAPTQPAKLQARESASEFTALVVEPDEAAQRQLLTLLSARGYRVVPVPNADVGLDLAHRLRFDVAFCSVHAPGLNWVELSEHLQPLVGAFVLLADGYNAELAADFEGDGRFVISKPIEERQLERVFASLGASRTPQHVSSE